MIEHSSIYTGTVRHRRQIERILAAVPDPIGTFYRYGLPASLLGAGFSLRLAAAEARAANGDVERSGNLITLRLPLLTLNGAAPSDTRGDGGHPDTQGHRSA